MRIFDRVIIAVGDTDRDAELLQYARVLPRLSPGVECHFVHVLNWTGRPGNRGAPVTHAQALARLETGVERHYGQPGAMCRVVPGDRVDRLLEITCEAAADLVLLGHLAGHSGRRALARRLAMKAPCSVWMRPEGAFMDVRSVIAAVDYSAASAYALILAARLAVQSGASGCLALHVSPAEPTGGPAGSGDSWRAGEQQNFENFAAPLDTGGAIIRPLFEDGGDVAHTVERVAQSAGADLVVMGSRGQSRSASLLLGSESDHMLMETKIPVLIAKRRGERIGLLEALLDRDFHLQDSPRFG